MLDKEDQAKDAATEAVRRARHLGQAVEEEGYAESLCRMLLTYYHMDI